MHLNWAKDYHEALTLSDGKIDVTYICFDQQYRFYPQKSNFTPCVKWQKELLCGDGGPPIPLRSALTSNWVEVDIQRCHPTILATLFPHPLLVRYAMKEDMTEFGPQSKELFLAALYAKQDYMGYNMPKAFKDMNAELHAWANNVLKDVYPSIYQAAIDHVEEKLRFNQTDRSGVAGSFLSRVAQMIESDLLIHAIDFAGDTKVKVRATLHDGFFVEKDGLPPTWVNDLQAYIRKQPCSYLEGRPIYIDKIVYTVKI